MLINFLSFNISLYKKTQATDSPWTSLTLIQILSVDKT